MRRNPGAVAGPVAALFLVGLLAAACGSSPTPSTTTTAPTTTSAPTTSTTSGSSSTSAVGASPCSTGVLGAGASFGGSAAGTSYYVISITNKGPSACSLDGYPSFKFYAPSGAGGAGAGPEVSLTVAHGGSAPASVDLSTGKSAQALVEYTDVPTASASCTQVASALVVPPGSEEGLPIAISFTPCGGSVTTQPFAPPGSESP